MRAYTKLASRTIAVLALAWACALIALWIHGRDVYRRVSIPIPPGTLVLESWDGRMICMWTPHKVQYPDQIVSFLGITEHGIVILPPCGLP